MQNGRHTLRNVKATDCLKGCQEEKRLKRCGVNKNANVLYVGMKSARQAAGGYTLPITISRKWYTLNVTEGFIQSC